MKRIGATLVLVLFTGAAAAQSPATSRCNPTIAPRAGGPQVADTAFDPPIIRPAFPEGKGPRVLLDEAHFNFHTVAGRYAPFVRVLRRDGFVVEALRGPLTAKALESARILVIANALSERTARGSWSLPNPPAFAGEEVRLLERWVSDGGSLLLIADHMPFPGAVETLAAAFGILVADGFATDSTCGFDELVFRRNDRSLADHPITNGRDRRERVDSVRTFTGQAFRLLGAGSGLLTLPTGAVVLLPAVAWQFSDSTPRIAAEGMLQGAALSHGSGRVAMFGEAAMFSAQVSGPSRRPMGMNAPRAGENPQFLLNVMHWLAAAQSPDQSRPWMFSAGALAYRISELNGWGIGPAAGAQRRLHKALRLDMNAGTLLSSSGFYDFSGVALDVGPALVHSGRALELGIGVGVASVVGGDNDGTGGEWIGGYLSGQGTGWFASRVGLTLRAAYREISTGRSRPSFSLSLAFRP